MATTEFRRFVPPLGSSGWRLNPLNRSSGHLPPPAWQEYPRPIHGSGGQMPKHGARDSLLAQWCARRYRTISHIALQSTSLYRAMPCMRSSSARWQSRRAASRSHHQAPTMAPSPSTGPSSQRASIKPSRCIELVTCLSPNPWAPRTTTGPSRTTRMRKSNQFGCGQFFSGPDMRIVQVARWSGLALLRVRGRSSALASHGPTGPRMQFAMPRLRPGQTRLTASEV